MDALYKKVEDGRRSKMDFRAEDGELWELDAEAHWKWRFWGARRV